MSPDEREQFALKNGHPPAAHGVVCIDFDGTIRPFGGLFDFPEPLPGAKPFMERLRDRDFTIFIFTSRLSETWHLHEGRDPEVAMLEQYEYIASYLDKYDIPFDFITGEKVPAIAYIDDKAIQFTDWLNATRQFSDLLS